MTSGSKPPFAFRSTAASRWSRNALRPTMKRSKSALTATGHAPFASNSSNVSGGQRVFDAVSTNVNLFGDERRERRRRAFIGVQVTARVAQVAQHQRIPEAAVIAAAAPD